MHVQESQVSQLGVSHYGVPHNQLVVLARNAPEFIVMQLAFFGNFMHYQGTAAYLTGFPTTWVTSPLGSTLGCCAEGKGFKTVRTWVTGYVSLFNESL